MAPAKKISTKPFLAKLNKNTADVLKSLSVAEVAKLIQELNVAYYNTGAPLVSDAIYDVIRDHLRSIDPDHPVLKEVGAGIAVGDNRKEKLPFYMGSLDKIKNDDPKALAGFKKKYPGSVMVSDKLDGVSCLVHYNAGVIKLFSRGDGKIGQNITNIIPYIKGIPGKTYFEKVEKEGIPIAVRGELIIAKDDWKKIADKGANARNTVSGAINAKTPDMDVLKHIQFVAYELINPDNHTPEAQIKDMKCLGFNIVHHELVKDKDLSEETLSKILVRRRENSPFEIDGIVVFHNESAHKRSIGDNPDYAFAFKSFQTMERAETTVTGVEWNISKDGLLKPTVIFSPVALDGVTIQKATGFNAKFIADNKIGPGARIIIIRSGQVIPYVKEVIAPAPDAHMPDIPYEWNATGVDAVVKTTGEAADAVAIKTLEYFFSKVDVPGLGPANVKKLYEAGYKRPRDIFEASAAELTKLEGFKEKSAVKLAEALKTRRATLEEDCVLLMDASNTMGRGMGTKKIEMIVAHIGPKILSERYVPSVTELVSIKGIEQKTAELFIENLPKCFKFLEDNGFASCLRAPAAAPAQSPAKQDNKLAHLNVVFTGVRSKEAEAVIVKYGGKVSSGVSKHTTLVVAKDPDGSSNTLVKARELGVKIISLEDFVEWYM